ncbi:MAG: SIR2 family protein [Armatimonadetes bacterium]|nr:SIR2 family protein [Armatimonadota bacterium]
MIREDEDFGLLDGLQFIREIQRELELGASFVPLLGAGFSVAAGVPILKELRHYLARCICLTFGIDTKVLNSLEERWIPGVDQWPDLVDPPLGTSAEGRFIQNVPRVILADKAWDDRAESVLNSFRQLKREVLTILGKELDLRDPVHRLVFGTYVASLEIGEFIDTRYLVVQCRLLAILRQTCPDALESGLPDLLAHNTQKASTVCRQYAEACPSLNARLMDFALLQEAWGSLHDWRSALQVLARVNRKSRSGETEMGAPKSEVYDSCFRKLYTGKKPALPHQMLAALANVLRINLILTPNFDDLTELAFQNAGRPLTTFEVGTNSSLPDPDALRGVRSIVKLHGGRSSIRADYSVDSTPSEQDRRCFCSYFDGEGTGRFLLVMGYSARDSRISAMFKELSRQKPGTTIFWVAYSAQDCADIRKLQTELESGCQIHLTKQSHLGLFLMELYQVVRKTVPTLGTIFPSPARLTMPPPAKMTAEIRKVSQEVIGTLTGAGQAVTILTAGEKEGGLTSIAILVHEEYSTSTNTQCLWIEMNDIEDSVHLFEVIVEAIHYKLGIDHWTPSAVIGRTQFDYPPGQPKTGTMGDRAAEVNRLLSSTGANWCLFVNCRETPGSNSDSELSGNGWVDKCNSGFYELMLELSITLRVIVIASESCGLRQQVSNLAVHHYQLQLAESNLSQRINTAMEYLHEDSPESSLLISLILMQRPRLIASIWTSETSDQLLCDRLALIEKYVEDDILRLKPGGSMWIHVQLRTELRRHIDLCVEKGRIARVHKQLAEWYTRLSRASRSPSGVLEGAYHLLKACRTDDDLSEDENIGLLKQAASLLMRNSYLIQTQGVAIGNMRKLNSLIRQAEDISNSCSSSEVTHAVQRFRSAAMETKRALAREGGYDVMAFNSQFVLRRLSDMPLKSVDKLERKYKKQREAGKINPSSSHATARWYRWCGMLHIAARSFDPALKQIKSAIEIAKQTNDCQQLARAYELEAELWLQKLGALGRLVRLGYPRYAPEVHTALEAAEQATLNGIASVHDAYTRASEESLDVSAVTLTHARLLLQTSIVAAQVVRDDRLTPLGYLEEAEGLLGEELGIKTQADYAVVEILRGEDALTRASSTAVTLGHGSPLVPVGSWIKSFWSGRGDKRLFSPPVEEINRLRSLCADAQRHLDRAAPLLQERRRSVLWSGVYLERRMRTMALSLWADPTKELAELPWISPGAALPLADTEIERCLIMASKIIRIDGYRFATILEAYIDAYIFLEKRISQTTETTEWASDRLERMRQVGMDALDQLTRIRQDRSEGLDCEHMRKWLPSEVITAYEEEIRTQAMRIFRFP